jgi:hypothetical protein
MTISECNSISFESQKVSRHPSQRRKKFSEPLSLAHIFRSATGGAAQCDNLTTNSESNSLHSTAQALEKQLTAKQTRPHLSETFYRRISQ